MKPAAAHVREGLAWLQLQPSGAPVPSPCDNVCRMDAASGLCEGCLRTLDEIAAWGGLDDAGKRIVWQRLGERALQQETRA